MYQDHEARRAAFRKFMRGNFLWIVPVVLIVGPALFYGFGKFVQWLWLVTLVDIFGIKAITFWQAWGLMLLAQFLFKANVQPTMRTGSRWRRARAAGCGPETGPEQPSHTPAS
jgi:hypothetical protein